jgi:adenine-specific DNA-methyltransferase
VAQQHLLKMIQNKRTKLELTWIGKENRPKLEPRILLEDPEKSYHAPHRVTDHDLFDNRLIFGDNLLALKALEQEFAGKIKCIYIDPPFNTDQAFEHYDDSVEHSVWLTLMRDRLDLLRRLISNDGTLFVHIDDNELAYLIVVLDEVFGRTNRITVITFKQGAPTGHKAINPGVVTTSNFVLIYAKDKEKWNPNRVYTARVARDKRYNQWILNPEEDFSGWKMEPLGETFSKELGVTPREAKNALGGEYENKLTDFVLENPHRVVRLARPDYDAISASARELVDRSKSERGVTFKLARDGYSDMYFVNGERILFYADKLKTVDGVTMAGDPLTTIWDDVLSNNLHNEGGVAFPKGKKPEALIKRCLELSTQRGDWVLDSFAGSGTTGAVAHKMYRRWILVELGEHCHTHVIPRLQRVIDAGDPSGITKAVEW